MNPESVRGFHRPSPERQPPVARRRQLMTRWGLGLCAAALGLAVLAPVPAEAADVGVSVSISQPGVYGRVDIGRFPQPVLVAPSPVVVLPPPVSMAPQPVYLWVPPGHQKNWRKHCAAYGACGVPVYFVQDRWYREHVAPAGPGRRAHGPDARRDHRDDHRGPPGRGHGHGHGR